MQLFKKIGSFFRDQSGLAAIESALILPMLVFGSLVVVDLGSAGATKIEMEQSIRAGAQFSMLNISDADEIAERTAASLGLTENGNFDADGLCEVNMTCVKAVVHCECEFGVEASCQALCPITDEPPSSFVTVFAVRQRDAFLLSGGNIVSKLTVQTR